MLKGCYLIHLHISRRINGLVVAAVVWTEDPAVDFTTVTQLPHKIMSDFLMWTFFFAALLLVRD